MTQFERAMYSCFALFFLFAAPVIAYHYLSAAWLVIASVFSGVIGWEAATMTPERHQRNIRRMEEIRERDRALFENRPQ